MARISGALDIAQVVTVGNALKTYKADVEALASGYGAFAALMLGRAATEFVPALRDSVVRVATVGDDIEVVISADTYVRLDADMRRFLLVAEMYTLLWERRYRAKAGAHINDLVMHACHHAEAVDLYLAPTPVSCRFDLKVVERFVEECVQEAEWETSEAATWLGGALSDLTEVLRVPAAIAEETVEMPTADWVMSADFQETLVTTLRGMTDVQLLVARPLVVMLARLASRVSQDELSEDPERRFFWANVFSEATGTGQRDAPQTSPGAGIEEVALGEPVVSPL